MKNQVPVNFKRVSFNLMLALCITFAACAAQFNFPENVNFGQIKPESYSYFLRIQFPNIKKMPLIRGYYKGTPLEFENDFCIIPEDKDYCNFTIFITKPEDAPQPKSDRNNIKYLKRMSDNCRLFYISRCISCDNSDEKLWKVKEEKIANLPGRIPDDAIILLMDPEHISQLKEEVESKSIEKIGRNNLVNLPKIIIKSDISQEILEEVANIAALAAIDLRATHRAEKKEIRKSGSVIISMRTP